MNQLLRTKEFLTKHGVPFVSINVLADKNGFAELAEPASAPCRSCARAPTGPTGRSLKDVAWVAGIKWGGAQTLPPAELVKRLVAIQQAAQRFFGQIPKDKTGQQLPNRPRSYAELTYHIFNIADAWLEHEVQGQPLKEGAKPRAPPEMKTKEQVLQYGRDVISGVERWWQGPGQKIDFSKKANVYYGDVDLHHFLERTAWHSASMCAR